MGHEVGRKLRVVAVTVESVAMAMAYGMAVTSYFWELYGFMTLLLAVGAFLNIMIVIRSQRWK